MFKLLLFCLLSISTITTASDHQWEKYKHKILKEQKKIPGWCVQEKADKLMQLIYDVRPQTVVEIGVFGGSSVYPMAEALNYCQKGVIYAIDPWKAEDCQEGYMSDDPNYIWWTRVDLEKVYKDFTRLIKHANLAPFCRILRMTSLQAVDHFAEESIDILHIDGNHSEESALRDAQLFLPKVKKGGYIWFDDVNWLSTNQAVQYLLEYCLFDPARSIGQECYLFKKL